MPSWDIFTLKYFCKLTSVIINCWSFEKQSMFYSYCAQNTFACLILCGWMCSMKIIISNSYGIMQPICRNGPKTRKQLRSMCISIYTAILSLDNKCSLLKVYIEQPIEPAPVCSNMYSNYFKVASQLKQSKVIIIVLLFFFLQPAYSVLTWYVLHSK